MSLFARVAAASFSEACTARSALCRGKPKFKEWYLAEHFQRV